MTSGIYFKDLQKQRRNVKKTLQSSPRRRQLGPHSRPHFLGYASAQNSDRKKCCFPPLNNGIE